MLNESLTLSRLRPLPGRCVIHLDPIPDKLGSLFLPDSARALKTSDAVHTGTVLAMSPRKGEDGVSWEEPFSSGDRVFIALRMEDLGKELIATHNTRVWACAG